MSHNYSLTIHVILKITVDYNTTRRSVSVNWVACGTYYTKTEGTELGGIEGTETGFSWE